MKEKSTSQTGAALFIILIAVALFAALSYAVTQSGRGSGSVDREKAMLDAASIVQYASKIQQTVMRLQLAYRCADTQISFENNIVTGYTNALAPTDKSCNVFDPAGGGLTWQNPPANTNNGSAWYIMGRTCVVDVGTGSTGCHGSVNNESEADLVLYLPYVTKNICIQLNNSLGVTNPGGDPPQEDNNGIQNAKFDGSYANAGLTQTGGSGEAANLNGKFSGCFEGQGAYVPVGSYHFYHVLIAR